LNWLRVFPSAEASRMSQGVWQQLHTRAVQSEKCVRLHGRVWAGMRVIAMFFGPCASDVLTAHVSVFSHDFKRLDRFTKLATSLLPACSPGASGTRERREGVCTTRTAPAAQFLLQGPGDGGKVQQLLTGRRKPGCLTIGCCEQGSWCKTSAAPQL